LPLAGKASRSAATFQKAKMINTKNYLIFFSLIPFGRDENTGKLEFIRPKFGLEILKGKPCVTRWLFDWILSVGWLTVMRRAAEHNMQATIASASAEPKVSE
jgi:hypothetical protein